jgi:hypothetical protein
MRDSLKEVKRWYGVKMAEAQAKEAERMRKMRIVESQRKQVRK